MMKRPTRAEGLLQSLGIDDPRDIDLEAIAWHVGAKIKVRPLVNCEARIIGLDDKAIISVNAGSSPERRRFSIGHELGHWAHHRGQCAVCRATDIGNYRNEQATEERAADAYAADLLMPWYLFKPAVRLHKRLDINSLRAVATLFSASLTATLIRMIDSDQFPYSMVVTHRTSGKPWVTRAPSMQRRWFAREDLDPGSFAFTMKYGKACQRYKAVREYLEGTTAFQDQIEHFYAQGSMAIDATISTRGTDDEYDIDIVAQLGGRYRHMTPLAILQALAAALQDYPVQKVVRQTRCVTLFYADNMHLDVTPALRDYGTADRQSSITHAKGPMPSNDDCMVPMNAYGHAEWYRVRTPNEERVIEAFKDRWFGDHQTSIRADAADSDSSRRGIPI